MNVKTVWWRPTDWALGIRLALTFSVVILVTIGVVTVIAQNLAVPRLNEIAALVNRRQAFRLAPFFADYYDRNGSWQGIEQQLEPFNTPMPPSVIDSIVTFYPNRDAALEALRHDRLILVDANGHILGDSQNQLTIGQSLPSDLNHLTVSIETQEQVVGHLLYTTQFENTVSVIVLTALRRILLSAGLAAGATAIGVSGIVAYRVTRPIRKLNAAARQLATPGEASATIPIETGDEIGQLTHSFNEMVLALNRQKKLRKQMFADIAHELRTPLSVMQLDIEGLQDGLQPSDQASASLLDELESINRLVEDLRLLSLADTGAISFQTEALDLNPFVHQIATLWHSKMQRQEIKFLIEIAEDLPIIQADRGRLTQTLNNLLSNALRYTPPHNSISFGARSGQKDVLLWVSDTGPGIDRKELPYIFDRFYRVDPSRSHDSGSSGLGLAIAKQWVSLHGGHIWAESEPGQGTQFFISLPVE